MCTTHATFTYFREVHLQTWNVCMQTTQLWTQTLYAMYIEITWMCKPLCIQSMYSSFIIDFRQSELFYWLNKNFLWEHLENICTKNQGYLVTWHTDAPYGEERPTQYTYFTINNAYWTENDSVFLIWFFYLRNC